MYVSSLLLILLLVIVPCDFQSSTDTSSYQSSGAAEKISDGYESSDSDKYKSYSRGNDYGSSASSSQYQSSDRYDYDSSGSDRYRSSDRYDYDSSGSDRYRSSDRYDYDSSGSDRYRSSDRYDRYDYDSSGSDRYRTSDRYDRYDYDSSGSDRYRSSDRYDRYDYDSSGSDRYRSSDRYDRYDYDSSGSDRYRSSDRYDRYDYDSSGSDRYRTSDRYEKRDYDSNGADGYIPSPKYEEYAYKSPGSDGFVSSPEYGIYDFKSSAVYDPSSAGGYQLPGGFKGYNNNQMVVPAPPYDPGAQTCYPFLTFSLGVAAGYMLKTCPNSEPLLSVKINKINKKGHVSKCPGGWFFLDEVKDTCFRFTINELEWEQARIECNDLGGNLAIITDGKKSEAITHYLSSHFQADLKNEHLWIALNDILDEENFVWDPTNKISEYYYENWFDNNPPDKDDQKNCVALLHDENWKWDHFDCHYPMLGLCERHPDEKFKCNTY